jgi:hypothetical protein
MDFIIFSLDFGLFFEFGIFAVAGAANSKNKPKSKLNIIKSIDVTIISSVTKILSSFLMVSYHQILKMI